MVLSSRLARHCSYAIYDGLSLPIKKNSTFSNYLLISPPRCKSLCGHHHFVKKLQHECRGAFLKNYFWNHLNEGINMCACEKLIKSDTPTHLSTLLPHQLHLQPRLQLHQYRLQALVPKGLETATVAANGRSYCSRLIPLVCWSPRVRRRWGYWRWPWIPPHGRVSRV